MLCIPLTGFVYTGKYTLRVFFCFKTENLIKALQDLENAASGDATVRQKIASLPQEVQDVSLLENIAGSECALSILIGVDNMFLL